MASTIEDHPQRKAIVDALLAGESIRRIASRISPPVSPAAVQRYRASIVAPAIRKVQAKLLEVNATQQVNGKPVTAPVLQNRLESNAQGHEARIEAARSAVADPLLERLRIKNQRRERWFGFAEEKQDARGLAALDTCETRDLELEARLTGRLDTAPVNVTNNFMIMPMPGQEPRALPEPAQVNSVTFTDAE